MLDFIKKHPAPIYFILTFAISWGCVFLVSGGMDGFPADAKQVEQLLPLVVLSLTIGPVLAGLVLTALVDGRAGLGQFFSQMFKWRVGLRWYAFALLLTPFLAAVSLLTLTLTSPVFTPGIITSGDKAGLLLSAVMAGLVGGLFEEPGWTWFATPRLRKRYSIFTTGLIVGLLWGAWHFIVALWGSGTPSGEFSPLLFLPQIVFYVAVLPAYRILMVWVYDHTGSLLVAMLMHMSLTGGVLFVFMPVGIPGIPLLIWYIALAVALWIVVGVIFQSKTKTERKGEI